MSALETLLAFLTKWAGPLMVVLQGILFLGSATTGKYDASLSWAGGVLLTIGALRMSGWAP